MHMHELPYPPVAGARSAAVRGLRDGEVFEATDWVAEEVPVALVYNGVSHAVMLASPSDLEDFAIGFSCSEGITDSPAQIYGIEVQQDERGITVALDVASSCFMRLKDRRRNLAGRTGCGLCGTESLATVVTMSGTVQPRLRSFTGRRRPWSTGPTATASAERCTAL